MKLSYTAKTLVKLGHYDLLTPTELAQVYFELTGKRTGATVKRVKALASKRKRDEAKMARI
jgi:hypothetical protein